MLDDPAPPAASGSTLRLGGCTFVAAGPRASSRADGRVDLILHRGRVYTVDPAKRVPEAIAIKDGRVVAVGSTADPAHGLTEFASSFAT